MYRAQVKKGGAVNFVSALTASAGQWERELREQGVNTVAVFAKEGSLFLYLEAVGEQAVAWQWPAPCLVLLEEWPGADGGHRHTVPMMPIYRDGEPPNARRTDAHERLGSLARLRPEMYSSYIFYHFALQEEKPYGFNPTYAIGAHEELIFSYHELPAPVFEPGAARHAWPESVLPSTNWHALMESHFQLWPGGDQGPVPWEKMNLIYCF
ncbi:hypothetical protein [Paenibacillus whitsoniae]|uniref:Uncharacterized protein n=1 Tax=Paenibacillus whitsoniae TaxID=2496558 RepID=A0A430JI45_9BACL|nr:hypothetical protein [Paenibacillus whitsoniae]RTE10693.1 hypothetical protein EJQ19_05320 [Paenibacillus whitsoniae]